ncbi:hypothetical protein MA16_Dca007756 [Dendrobium catenatum]|uniref:Uncharacterized protein n=1 Tax=Dendrobium catenatum TaxID=906689 RepID=A0A2I0X5A2_9ASPA|nr:hypothetical protein MA16_Dca007756 [Dendrobium catenatum]
MNGRKSSNGRGTGRSPVLIEKNSDGDREEIRRLLRRTPMTVRKNSNNDREELYLASTVVLESTMIATSVGPLNIPSCSRKLSLRLTATLMMMRQALLLHHKIHSNSLNKEAWRVSNWEDKDFIFLADFNKFSCLWEFLYSYGAGIAIHLELRLDEEWVLMLVKQEVLFMLFTLYCSNSLLWSALCRSMLVLNGNGADLAKYRIPAVSYERISVTFRNKTKQPHNFKLD